MKNNLLTKKLLRIGAVIIFILILATPFVYVFYIAKIERGFWDNAMGNMFATILALIAGIPIALWIDRRIKLGEEERTYIYARMREKDLLELIKEELQFSLNSLFLQGKKGNSTSMIIQPLKSDLWESLTASEEIKYIEDPNLLNRIASAYYVLKIVKGIEEQAYVALRTSAIQVTLPDGTKKSGFQLLLEDARRFDKLFEDSTDEALKMINTRISNLQKYTK